MSNYLFNGTQKVIDVGASGSPTAILATGPLRRFKIRESPVKADGTSNSNFPQGFLVTMPGTTQTFERLPASATNEPSSLPTFEIPDPDDNTVHEASGYVLGNGPDTPGAGVAPTLATTLCNVSSLTMSVTSVEVTQIY